MLIPALINRNEDILSPPVGDHEYPGYESPFP